jgi:ferritin
MLSKAMLNALNDQINKEFFASYLYLSMSAYFEAANYPGFAQWMRVQSQEEYEHGLKIFNYINDRDGKVVLKSIDQPKADFKSPTDAFTQALEHERKVTGMINKLYEMALKENDYPTQVMLQWFISEQVEEEKTALGIVDQLKMVGDAPAAMIMLDRQLGARSKG